MPDFLSRLAARTLGLTPVAQPVVPVMYAAEGAQPERSPSLGLEEVDKPAVVSGYSPATERQPTHGDSRRLDVMPEAPLVPVQRGPVTPATHDAPYSLSAGPRHRESDFPEAPRVPFQAEREIAPGPPIAAETSTSPIAESRVRAGSPSAVGGERERVVAAPATPRREMIAETNSPAAGLSSFAVQPVSLTRRAPEAPVIRVNIGRVEVRAEFPPPAARPVTRRSQSSTLSLEEYARQRKEGLR